MKKFLTTISKKNISKIFLLFLAFLLVILFSSIKTVYAAESNNSSLYDGSDFRIDSFTNDGSSVYINVTSKLPRNGTFANHLNFSSCELSLNNETVSYSLTCVNENDNGFIYSSYEKYLIEDFSLSPSINFKLLSIGNYDLSERDIRFSTLSSGLKKLITAKAYGYISTVWNMGVFGLGSYYESLIYFDLYVDGVGFIDPSRVESVKFSFVDTAGCDIYDYNHLVYIDSNFSHKGTKDVSIDWKIGSAGYKAMAQIKDAYYYDLTEPSRTDRLSKKFSCEMYASDSPIKSQFLNWAKQDGIFNDLPFDFYENCKYFIHMKNCPNLNSGLLRTGDEVNSFGIVEFSYFDNDFDLVGASLFDPQDINNESKPIYVISNELGELRVVTLDDEGNIIPAIGYTVDEYGNVFDPNGKFVGFGKNNYFKGSPDPTKPATDLLSWIKKIITVVLFIFAIILILRIVGLFRGFSKKDNNVNITVKSGSSKGRRRK